MCGLWCRLGLLGLLHWVLDLSCGGIRWWCLFLSTAQARNLVTSRDCYRYQGCCCESWPSHRVPPKSSAPTAAPAAGTPAVGQRVTESVR